MAKKAELARLATLFLRRNGYRADGRQSGSVKGPQVLFGRRLVYTPVGGKPATR